MDNFLAVYDSNDGREVTSGGNKNLEELFFGSDIDRLRRKE
jgi:hypothetical protein